MARITVLGGTGYAGGHIVAEAASRGHDVIAVSRTPAAEPVPGVTYVTGDVLDAGFLLSAVEGADVVVEALSPRGDLEGRLAEVVRRIGAIAQSSGTRVGVVGGAGSLLAAEGGPRLVETEGFPAEFAGEAIEMGQVLDDLRAAEEPLDWFCLSPSAVFGAGSEGEHTGDFRLGGDVLLVDANGDSTISGADFAQAFVDEIDDPQHTRRRFTVGY